MAGIVGRGLNKQVSDFPAIYAPVGKRVHGIRRLPPEDVIRNIDEWTAARPDMAADPERAAYYAQIRAEAVAKLAAQAKRAKRSKK